MPNLIQFLTLTLTLYPYPNYYWIVKIQNHKDMLLQDCRTAGLEDAATACMDAYALVSSVKDTKIACMHYKIAIAIAYQ
jgi:hypothetical protein